MKEIEVFLEKVKFQGYHGVYEYERAHGNQYEVSLRVKYLQLGISPDAKDELNSTVSYVELFEILKSSMAEPKNLLETVGCEVLDKIKKRFPQVTEIECSISKLTPPIPGFIGEAGVVCKEKYEFKK